MTSSTAIDYGPEQVKECLTALVSCGGNAAEAQRLLRAEYDDAKITWKPPTVATLRKWKDHLHHEQYRQMEGTFGRDVEDELIHWARQNARKGAEAVSLAIDKAMEDLRENKCRDPGRTASDLAKVMSTSVQEVLRLTGRPTEITASQDMSDVVANLLSRGILKAPDGYDADTTAVEDSAPTGNGATR